MSEEREVENMREYTFIDSLKVSDESFNMMVDMVKHGHSPQDAVNAWASGFQDTLEWYKVDLIEAKLVGDLIDEMEEVD